MLRVIDVEYIKDYQLLLTFNDGISKLVDLEKHLTGEVFGPLRDKKLFIQFALTRMTIEWVNGADLAPEFLYDIGKTQLNANCVLQKMPLTTKSINGSHKSSGFF